MRIKVSMSAAGLALLASGIFSAAAAQEVLRAPTEIRACLCREQAVSTLASEVQAQSQAYEERRKALQGLDNQVRTRRPQVNVSSQQEVDAFKQLLDERDKAADAFAGEVTRNYADAVSSYNQAVASFNTSCAGRAYDQEVLAQVRGNLSCPKP